MKKTDRELLQSALDALEHSEPSHKNLCAEIRARLAEPEEEPVVWMNPACNDPEWRYNDIKTGDYQVPLYRHPRHPVRLSDEEICEIAKTSRAVEGKAMLPVTFARAIESAIWEKNQ